jgi:hypothetical protein
MDINEFLRTPQANGRRSKLAPHDDAIRKLRAGGASYQGIVTYLRIHGVSTTWQNVRKYILREPVVVRLKDQSTPPVSVSAPLLGAPNAPGANPTNQAGSKSAPTGPTRDATADNVVATDPDEHTLARSVESQASMPRSLNPSEATPQPSSESNRDAIPAAKDRGMDPAFDPEPAPGPGYDGGRAQVASADASESSAVPPLRPKQHVELVVCAPNTPENQALIRRHRLSLYKETNR